MVDFVGVMKGFNEQEKVNNQSRRDMAKAFADFKAANPYASAAEFQSFIDSYSGGRNYIAGGAPGSEILSALGARNQETQAADILRQQIADATSRNKFRNDLQTSAESFLLNVADKEPDFVQGYEQFIAEMGVNPEMGRKLFGEQNLSSIFNQQNLNRLRLDEMNRNMPAFMDYLKSTGGDVDDADFKSAAKKYGIPEFMVKDARKIYKEQTDNARMALESERKQELTDLAIDAIERGDPDINSLVTGRAKTLKFDTNAPEFKTYVQSIVKQANTTATQRQTDRRNAQFDELTKFVNDEIALGNDQMLAISLDQKAKELQIDTKNTAWKAYKERVLAKAKIVRDTATDDRNRRINTENAAAANTFRTTLENNRGINDLIQRGRLDEAQARIDEMVGRYSDVNVKALMKEIGDGFINARVGSLQEVQDNKLGELRMKADELVNQSSAEYKTNNTAKAEQYFTAYAGKGQTNPNAGIHGGNAAMAATTLASEYNMSPTVLALMADAFKTMPEGSSPLALAEAARKSIAGYAQPLSAAQALYSSQQSGKMGYFGQDTTVADWTAKTSMTIDQHASNIQDQITKVKELQNVDPATKVKMLEGLSARLEQGFANIRTSIQQADEYATGELGWVTKGTPMFSINDVYYGENGLKKNIDAMTSSLNKEIKELSSSYSQQAVQAPSAKANVISPNTSNPSAFSQGVTSIVDDLEKSKALESISTGAGTKSSVVGSFFNDPDTQLYNKVIKQFLDADGVKNRLKRPENQAEFDLFVADPFNYIYNSDYGQKWLNSEGAEFKDLALAP